MIYPIDFLCKMDIDFNTISDFETMKLLIESLHNEDFKAYIANLTESLQHYLILDANITKEILCDQNILKSKKAQWFYENLFSDITKQNGKVLLKKKIIYTICENCKSLSQDQKTISLNGFIILEIKHIKLSSLIRRIKKYQIQKL